MVEIKRDLKSKEQKVYFDCEEMRKIWSLNNDTLIQLQCASKFWNNLKADRSLIQSQLQRTKLYISEFIFQDKFPWLNKDIKIVTYILVDEEGFQFKQTILDFHPKDVVVSSSCQGLIFCSCFPTQDVTIYICILLNKEKTKLSWDSLGNDSIISFAFDPSQNLIHISTEFKLVKVEAIDIGEEEEKLLVLSREENSATNDAMTRWKHQNILSIVTHVIHEMRKIRCSNNDEFFEVIYLLPTETLFQLKCVSKTWNNLISDRSFIRSQLQRTKLSISEFNFQDQFLWLNKYIKTVTYISIDEEGFQFKQTIFDFHPKDVVVLSSCQGLISCRSCFPTQDLKIYICNPLNKEMTKLSWDSLGNDSIISLAFDPSQNPIHISTEFKLVTVEAFEIREEEEKNVCDSFDIFVEPWELVLEDIYLRVQDKDKTLHLRIHLPRQVPMAQQRYQKFTYIPLDEEGFQFKQTFFDFHPDDVVLVKVEAFEIGEEEEKCFTFKIYSSRTKEWLKSKMRKIRCLNNDVFIEVLYLLPTKTLFQLKCVSKTWNNLISDRSFIHSQLQRTKLSISEFIFQDKFLWLNKEIKIVTYIPLDEEGFQFKQTFFDFHPDDVVVLSSCQGLIFAGVASLLKT
ncbi:hypothetical protein G4B88_003329 [Cannabis sativa]|uniref:F-box domain-containing protein n=1 Tax=Cannabis sativa TaxID=3483 RepID=A0A7J6FDK5_CANSA|nr:hypothetical protein G4B88_003329 [Cannabis sativa]